MLDLANNLRSFREAELTLKDLLALIEDALHNPDTDAKQLRAIIDEENEKHPLPDSAIRAITDHLLEAEQNSLNETPDTAIYTPLNDTSKLSPDTVLNVTLQPNSNTSPDTVLNEALDLNVDIDSDDLLDELNAANSHTSKESNHPEPKTTDRLEPAATEAVEIPEVLESIPESVISDKIPHCISPVFGAESPDHVKEGDLLNNRFELLNQVGRGGMSTVFLALDHRRAEAQDQFPYVAVKVLNLEFNQHAGSFLALQREAARCQTLSHPNIVRVFDYDRDDSTVYMTMEYLAGQSLRSKLAQPSFSGMSLTEALPIINAVGNALAFAHSRGIVHLDLTPSNIIITDSGEIKVIDFGIARVFQQTDTVPVAIEQEDQDQVVAFTPSYASPEILEFRHPDPRDDIYAFACIVYQMLTGVHPFHRTRATDARDAKLRVIKHKRLTYGQWRVLRKALAFDRNKRTPSIQLLLAQLNARYSSVRLRATASVGLLASVLISASAMLHYFPDLSAWYTQLDLNLNNVAQNNSTVDANSRERQSALAEDTDSTKTRSINVSTTTRHLSSPRGHKDENTLLQPGAILQSIAPLIRNISCSVIQPKVEGLRISLQGFARPGDIARLSTMLKKAESTESVVNEIRPIQEYMCEVVDLFGPFWLGNRKPSDKAIIMAKNNKNEFVDGEELVLSLKSPAYDSYLNVDYYSLDGGVLHLLPSNGFESNQAPSNYQATIGDLGEWRVGAPYGTELIVLLAAPQPLFKSLRSTLEPKHQYLSELKPQLELLRKKYGSSHIAADFVLITTRAGS